MNEDIVDYLSGKYEGKIVEIGVGHRPEIARMLKGRLPAAEIVVTDTNESVVRTHNVGRVRAVLDDVFSPSLNVYQGASLIYSINPPPEFLPAIEGIAGSVGADVFVKPISDEQDVFRDNEKWRPVLVRGQQIGWLLKRRR